MSDPMQEIRASFFLECEELIEALHDGLEELDPGRPDAETINVIFRSVHSIKGGAGAFALDDLVAFSHAYETCLDLVRSAKLSVSGELRALFLRGADMLSDLVAAARTGDEADAAAVSALVAEFEAAAGTTPDAGDDAAVPDFTPQTISLDLELPAPVVTTEYRIELRPSPAFFEKGHEVRVLMRALDELGDLAVEAVSMDLPTLADYDPLKAEFAWKARLATSRPRAEINAVFEFVEGLCALSVETGDTPADPQPAVRTPAGVSGATPPPRPAARQQGTKPAAAPSTVRVDLDRIERLVNLVGELVINQSMLAQSISEAGLNGQPKIASGLDEFLQLTRDIQDGVMLIRAQPVKSLFQRMSRIARESSAAVGKPVRLETEGEATEIDKTMIERLSDPLTHMVRNAIDHGLESTEARARAGKDPTGTVRLSASHRSGRVVIEVADDGGGIDRTRVLEKAVTQGLVPADAALSESEIDQLLFTPGFSTAGAVSSISGRGVGMDVVRNTITGLGGRISIGSRPGQGTSFSISLPLTLAVLDGMVVEAGGETLVIPINAILETLTIDPAAVTSAGHATPLLWVRDSFVPLVDLAQYLGYRAAPAPKDGSTALLIAQDDGARVAIVVSAIHDQRQVVIKGLEHSYGRVPGIAAATILGDGRIALILDPNDLCNHTETAIFAEAG